MRRLLRWLFNGLCLLSLLACAGVTWLWWRGSRAELAWLEVAAFGTDLTVYGGRYGTSVLAVRHWPGGPGLWAGEGDRGPYPILLWTRQTTLLRTYPPPTVVVRLRPDGAPLRVPLRERAASWSDVSSRSLRISAPLPYWEANDIPPWLPVAVLSLPPTLWLVLRSRRPFVRRRHRRLGLCLRCGHNLRGNTSGKCSECGEAVTAERTVTA